MKSRLAPKYVVTLVHGTFAKNAGWIGDGSYFRESVDRSLGNGVKFRVLRWSGKNSQTSRIAASRQLRSYLKIGLSEYPDSAHFVVAHSHGGNVLMYALKESSLQRRLSGCICLGTPFILPLKRDIEASRLTMLFAALATSAAAILYLFLSKLGEYGAFDKAGFFESNFVFFKAVPWLLLYGIPILLLLWLLSAGVSLASERLIQARTKVSTRMQLPRTRFVRLLCVGAAGDEASAFLSFMEMLSSLPLVLLHPYIFSALAIATLVMVLTNVLPAMIHLPVEESTLATWKYLASPTLEFLEAALSAGIYCLVVFLAAIIVAILCNVVFRVLPWGLRLDTVLESLGIKNATTPFPASAGHTTFLDFATGIPFFLGHSSLMFNKEVASEIAEWVKRAAKIRNSEKATPAKEARRR